MKYATSMRIATLLLALVMVLGMIPTVAFATESEETATSSQNLDTTEETKNENTESEDTVTEGVESEDTVTEGIESEDTVTEDVESEDTVAEDNESEVAVIGNTESEENDESEPAAQSEDSALSLTIASSVASSLAPGVTETAVVAYDANGDRVQYFVVNANIASTETVEVKANYQNNDNSGTWGKATVIEQANAATEKRGYNVVATTNASYYNVSTGQPTGGFVMEGVNINGNSAGNSYPFFAILNDGTAMIGQKGTFSTYADQIQEAVGGWSMLVWDSEIVATNNTSKYPRSTVGVKANGDVVLMVADGNISPTSIGLTYVEQAEIMLSLGCVAAIELDGGGSATYAAKLEGTDEVVLRNTPCDGTIRSVSNSLMVISTAVADGTFDHANLATDYAYYAPNSVVEIDVVGADAAGGAAEVPENVTWALSDASYGTIENGVFTSNGLTGTVTVQMLLDGNVVGSVDITLVNPTSIAFSASEKTVPYGQTSDFSVTAMYNGAEVYAAASAYDFVVSDGSLDGFIYTAPSDESVTSATVTATYKYADLDPAAVTVTFGKGSEVLFTFELDDPDRNNWGDYFDLVEAAENGAYTNGYTVIYETEGSPASNLVEKGIQENVFLASKADGAPVCSGDYSLGYTLDYTQSESHANWQYAYLYFWGDPVAWRDVDNGVNGTRLGMWMYIPEEAVGSCARLCYTYETSDGSLNVAYLYFTYQYVSKGFSKLTSEKIPEAGWAYVYCDLDDISETYVSSAYYKDADGNLTRAAATNYAPAFIQFIVSSSATGAEKCTFYIDDITLDYSDVVDDRDAPIISNPLALDDLNSYAMGSTLSFNTVSFTASVAEDTSHGNNYTGLNAATAQIYVDGQKVATTYSAGKIAATGVVLPDGVHDITFEIADNQGNYTKLTKQITIAAGSDYAQVWVEGAAPGVNSDGNLYTGSQYDLLLKTDKVEAIDSITTTIWLNSASEWALEHMSTLYGFEVTYTVDELACNATIAITRTGDVEATGEATLVTIPVYGWSWDGVTAGHTATDQWNGTNGGGGCAPQIDVSFDVKYGAVTYTADYAVTESNYVAGFGSARCDVDTELNSSIANLKKTIGEWHYHTEGDACDLDATCTTDGYTGRVFCTVCGSVVAWGTTIPATGHTYEVGDDSLCDCADCGKLFSGVHTDGKTYVDGVAAADGWHGDSYYVDGVKLTGIQLVDGSYYNFGDDGVSQGLYTGLFTMDGYTYYAVSGVLKSGWYLIDSDWYYFSESTCRGYDGVHSAAECHVATGFNYTFENGRLTECVWVETSAGLFCYYGPNYYKNGWQTIDGKEYYFAKDGAVYRGYQYITSRFSGELQWYYFDETTGALIEKMSNTGFLTVDGTIYFLEDGISTHKGLFEYEGDYYYVNSAYTVVTGIYHVVYPNGLLNGDGKYEFDETGKLIKNGVHYYASILTYLVDGVPTAAGLIYDETEGCYYYARTGGKITFGEYTVYASKTNGLLPAGTYDFGDDGKLFIEEDEEEVKNGLVYENGAYYYYVDGVLTYAGLIYDETEGCYYYIRSNYKAATGTYHVYASKTNGLLPAGTYDFGDDGKLFIQEEEEAKNGFVYENGAYYYYVDGVLTYAGLIYDETEGCYYYVRSNYKMATGVYTVYASRTNGLLPAGTYDFGDDGKLFIDQEDDDTEETVKNGFVYENGAYYYYVDGELTYAGLIYDETEGCYYYVRSNYKMATGTYHVYAAKTNGLLPAGTYDFGDDGKLFIE